MSESFENQERRPRHKPLRQVGSYQQIVGNIISHASSWDLLDAQRLKNTIATAEILIYKQLRAELLQLDPGKDSPQVEKERHCDSVLALRDSHKAMRRKIAKANFYAGLK